VLYGCAQIQLELTNIQECTKMRKSCRFWGFENLALLTTTLPYMLNFVIFIASNIRYSELKFYTLVEQNIVCMYIYFQIYWNFELPILNFSKKAYVARSARWFPLDSLPIKQSANILARSVENDLLWPIKCCILSKEKRVEARKMIS
jgi:hypothetical protein